ncbi:50S ribosomal protein L30 [Candidatus Woesearchaeota archaeon]|nr:50S ribosomal protein L30 [Candidatus Woesearchaeota archaeon]|tara:strand:+ start:1416 stop:1679 length:264 start_codon:yes stop_codon:yes gene_type:complete
MAVSEIKNNLKNKRIVLGTNLTLKNLKLGTVSKVFLSSNCPENVKKDVNYYCKLSDCSVENLKLPNEELGVVCRKPFSVSVVGLLKQ